MQAVQKLLTVTLILQTSPLGLSTAFSAAATAHAAANSGSSWLSAFSLRLPAGFRRMQERDSSRWDKRRDNRDTIASAYSSAKGQDPTGPPDAFTMESAEASATSSYDGVYYNDFGNTTKAGDMAKGGWSGAYTKNIPDNIRKYPMGTASAIASNFDTEMSSQRGPMAISGTYEGARAVAGSSGFWNLAQKDSWGGAVSATNIDTYGPTPGKPTLVRKGDDPYGRRSVAFTNIAPNSAAQTGAGNGPAAISSGYEVASAARAARDRKPPPVTIGHRDTGDNGVLETLNGRRHRLLRRLLVNLQA